MDDRDRKVLNMQLVLIPRIAEAWKKNYRELSRIFEEYGILEFIDVSYEKYNSIGIDGIIEDLNEYIKCVKGAAV